MMRGEGVLGNVAEMKKRGKLKGGSTEIHRGLHVKVRQTPEHMHADNNATGRLDPPVHEHQARAHGKYGTGVY